MTWYADISFMPVMGSDTLPSAPTASSLSARRSGWAESPTWPVQGISWTVAWTVVPNSSGSMFSKTTSASPLLPPKSALDCLLVSSRVATPWRVYCWLGCGAVTWTV